MNSLQSALDEYLSARRAFGYKLRWDAGTLQRFVDFAKRRRVKYITTELAMEWATLPANAMRSQWANRLGMVRRFARYCHAYDPRNMVPPRDLLPYRYRRVSPYLYSDEQIHKLIKAARKLPSVIGLRPHTYATLLGLYVAAGLRASEAIQLRRDDVDLYNGVLSIRNSKFGKSRYVPVHASTQVALQRYAARRDRLLIESASPCFFLSDNGTHLTYPTLKSTFVKISIQAGLRSRGDSRGPRLHDFRHRLAIHTLLKWYRHGVDVERQLPKLSTYLGHTNIAHTQWYLTATPQLLRYALNRVEQSERGVRS
jgi:integrase/recombinase XerD